MRRIREPSFWILPLLFLTLPELRACRPGESTRHSRYLHVTCTLITRYPRYSHLTSNRGAKCDFWPPGVRGGTVYPGFLTCSETAGSGSDTLYAAPVVLHVSSGWRFNVCPAVGGGGMTDSSSCWVGCAVWRAVRATAGLSGFVLVNDGGPEPERDTCLKENTESVRMKADSDSDVDQRGRALVLSPGSSLGVLVHKSKCPRPCFSWWTTD